MKKEESGQELMVVISFLFFLAAGFTNAVRLIFNLPASYHMTIAFFAAAAVLPFLWIQLVLIMGCAQKNDITNLYTDILLGSIFYTLFYHNPSLPIRVFTLATLILGIEYWYLWLLETSKKKKVL